MDAVSKKDIQKLDYNTCNQLRFDFRDNIHKYALVFIVFMGAYLAYGKYVLDQFPKSIQVIHNSKDTQSKDDFQNDTTQLNTIQSRYYNFLAFVGIAFGVSLSLSSYVGLRMYCRSRSLSVCAIRTQQILRDEAKGEAPLLSGLKVLNHQKYHAAIPHGVSRGEYQAVFLLCILVSAPIFLSHPFFDILVYSTKGTYPRLTEMCWLLVWGGFLFFCANTAENTFGHLSEADSITHATIVPILQKKWGNDGRDPGSRIFRKEWQRIFYRGYAFLFILLLFIQWHNSTFKIFNWTKNAFLSYLIYLQDHKLFIFALSFFLLALFLSILKKIRMFDERKAAKKAKFLNKSIFYISMICYFFSLLTIFKYIGHVNPFLCSLKWFWLLLAFILLAKVIILIKYKIERFNRLSMLLQSQAIYYSAKKYGIHNSNQYMTTSDIKNFTLDILAYRIFKKSCFTYKECFDHEDCRKSGDFFSKLLEYEFPNELIKQKKTKRLKTSYKIISLIYPQLGRMLHDCWNVEKIGEDFCMNIKKDEDSKDKIAVFFPTWLGDCIMARGAIKIVNANFDDSVICVSVLGKKQNEILDCKIDTSLIIPEMPKTSLKHAKLKLFSNWFEKKRLNNKLIYTLDRQSFRAAFFLNRNYHLANKIQSPTEMYNETEMREEDDFKDMHRVYLIAQFITNHLKKMGYEENAKKRDGRLEYSIRNTLADSETIKRIGIFPISGNHNKYKGWGSSQTAELINCMKEKYGKSVELVMFESKKYKKYINQIKKNTEPGNVEFCQESCDEFKKLSYIITVDTGSLHMAQLYNIPSAGLYGPTHPHETGPFPNEYLYNKHRIIKTRTSRSNDNIRVDKNIILSEKLLVTDVYNNVCEHLNNLGILTS